MKCVRVRVDSSDIMEILGLHLMKWVRMRVRVESIDTIERFLNLSRDIMRDSWICRYVHTYGMHVIKWVREKRGDSMGRYLDLAIPSELSNFSCTFPIPPNFRVGNVSMKFNTP